MITWNRRETWVGVFDILGFKRIVSEADKDFPRLLLTSQLDDIYETLKSDMMEHGKLDFLSFSDTFVIFTSTLETSSYPWFLLQCIQTIEKSIQVRLPLRGAISVGSAYTSTDPPIVLGQSFLEAYDYCEDQNWIGLLLTPSATIKLREHGLEPLHHDFRQDDIPLQKMLQENVLAYRFQNGEANFVSPYLAYLQEMRHYAPDKNKEKYTRTMEFIKKHYRFIQSDRDN